MKDLLNEATVEELVQCFAWQLLQMSTFLELFPNYYWQDLTNDEKEM